MKDANISELKEWQVWDMIEGWTQMTGATIENGVTIKSGLEDNRTVGPTHQRLPKRRLPVRIASKVTLVGLSVRIISNSKNPKKKN